MLCAEYDPARAHGEVTWREYEGLTVVEIVNNWRCRTFEETYRPPLIGSRIEHVLQATQPDVVHLHSLLTLSFDLPARARTRGAAVVATLHDYTLVCPSGGQRLHRADRHLCTTIDTTRCARCFRESDLYAQTSFAAVAAATRSPLPIQQLAAAAVRRVPAVAAGARQAIRRASVFDIDARAVDDRLTAARQLFDDVDLFVAPSPSIGREFTRLGMPPGKIVVSDYGTAPLPPSGPGGARRARSGARLPLRLGFVGTIVWHKGVHVLIDAVRSLPSDAYELDIFGDDTMFPAYTAALRTAAADRPIRFRGPFDRSAASDVYASLDLLVVPSLWLENSPLVVHEAVLAGVPVVGARIGGIPDLVQDGVTGLLYDPDAPGALRDLLDGCLRDPGRLDSLSPCCPLKTMAEDADEWEARYRRVARR